MSSSRSPASRGPFRSRPVPRGLRTRSLRQAAVCRGMLLALVGAIWGWKAEDASMEVVVVLRVVP